MTFDQAMSDKALQSKARRLATPDGYAEERLGMKMHPKQGAVLRDLFSRDGSRVVNRCANEVGKTRRVLTAAILYAIEIRGAVAVSTAGVWRQIEGQLIPSLKGYAHLFNPNQWAFLDTGIKRVNPKTKLWEWAYTGVSTKDEHYFQGYHKDADRPLFIAIDECQGVAATICNAAEDRCNPTWFLATGSPGSPEGAFYEMETSKAKHYSHHHISRMECLEKDGWWLKEADIQRLIEKHGKDNPFVLSTVFGEFSTIVENALISLTEYDRCLFNPPQFKDGVKHAFCDFAAGRDKNVLAYTRGNRIQIRKKWVERDTMSAVGGFVREFVELRKSDHVKPEEISGDADGLGLPMIHRMWEQDWRINEFHGGAHERYDQGYRNQISEAYGEAVKRIKRGEVILPDDPDLKAQLVGRKCRVNSSGELEVEKKEDYKKRAGESPDEADAVVCSMMPPPQAKSFNLIEAAQEIALQTQEEGANDAGVRTYF